MKKPKKPVPAKSAPKNPPTIDQNGFEDIREDFGQVLEGVIQRNKKGEVVEQLIQVVSQEIFSGPLPHPKHLQAYESACPGAADRILAMAERSQDKQLEIPGEMIDAESSYRMLGLKLGFATLVTLVFAAVFCAYEGHPKVAAGFITVGVLGTVGRFIDGRRNIPATEDSEEK